MMSLHMSGAPARTPAHTATRVADQPARPVFGPITLFLGAAALFMVTSLFYLWQQGQIEADRVLLHNLTAVRTDALNTQEALMLQAHQLTSLSRVQIEAQTLYHMVPASAASVAWMPSSTLPNIAAVTAPPATTSHAQVAATLPLHNASMLDWWQTGWDALSGLFR